MRDLLVLFVHLIVTIVRLAKPGGLRAVVAESVLTRHQILILNRSRKRAPNLRVADRIIAGLCTLLMHPSRVRSGAALVGLFGLCPPRHKTGTAAAQRHPVASKIPILLIRLGLKHFDSGLAIMGFEDAESPRPIPVLADLRGRMDEPTAAIRHRLPSRRESSPKRAAWRPTASAQRRSATASGGQGQTTDPPGSGGGRPHRDAGDTISVAPETDRPQIRRSCSARAGTAAHRRRDRGFGGSHGRRESGLGLPAHTRRALQSRLPNRARDRRQYPEAAWH